MRAGCPPEIGFTALTRTNAVRLSVACAVLLIVGAFAVWSRAEPEPAAVEARPIDLLCGKCGNHATLSYDEFMRAPLAMTADETRPVAGAGRSRSAHTRRADFACPSCGEKTAQPASKCPKHETFYAKYTETGGNARCPDCARGG